MTLPILDSVAGGVFSDPHGVDELVLGELWISFVSLLRSHLGALQTTGRLVQAHFTELSLDEIEIVDLARTLKVSLQRSSGEGEWSLTRMGEMIAAGDWILRSDATAAIDAGQAVDMEFAVELFAEKLWARTPQAAATPIAGENRV